MSKNKPPAPDAMTKARIDTCDLLHLDPDKLSAADELRITTIAALRLVIDSEAAKAASASGADLGRLVAATELLTKLAPSLTAPPADRRTFLENPRQAINKLIVGAVQSLRSKMDPEELSLRNELDRLRAELAALRGAPRAPVQRLLRPPPPSRSSRSRRSSRTPPGRRAGLSQLVKFFHTKRNVDMISEMNEQIARAEAAVKALEEKHITHARAARQADA